MVVPLKALTTGSYSRSGSMMMTSSFGRSRSTWAISCLADSDFPDPDVPRTKPLPLLLVVRSATIALLDWALVPYQTPPGWKSSWVVKGTMMAAAAVVRVRRIGIGRTPIGSSVVSASSCMYDATSAVTLCLRSTPMARLTFWSSASRLWPLIPTTITVLNTFWFVCSSSARSSLVSLSACSSLWGMKSSPRLRAFFCSLMSCISSSDIWRCTSVIPSTWSNGSRCREAVRSHLISVSSEITRSVSQTG